VRSRVRGALLTALLLFIVSLGTLAAGREDGTSPAAADSVADTLGAVAAGGSHGATGGTAGSDSSAGGEGVDPSLAPVPWKIGEYFQFSIDWNGLNGGSSLMQVQNIQRLDGRRVYRIVTKSESNSFVSKFYKVRDRAESYIDAESLYSRRFVKHLREGSYKKDVDVRFDQETHKAAYDDGASMDVPARVHDVLSAFYYVRTQPLPAGATLLLPTHDNKRSYDMEVKVHKRERVQVPAGTFDCVVVEPILKSEGVFKSKGSILVWLSDDARRIPVMVKSKVPVGSISISLTDMRLSFQRKP
jgi:Protein of unknown function (DUF3108)